MQTYRIPRRARSSRARPLAPWLRIVREPGVAQVASAPVSNAEQAAALFRPLLAAEAVECVAVVCLDAQSRPVAAQVVTRGLATCSLTHPREVFQLAIAHGAVGLLVAHNHPSGSLDPSAEDTVVTRQLVAAGRLLDIPVHDHLILAPDGRYTSLAERGMLDGAR